MFARGPCDDGLRPFRRESIDLMNHPSVEVPEDFVAMIEDEICLSREIMAENIKAQHLYAQGDIQDALSVLEGCYEVAQPVIPSAETLALKRQISSLLRNIAHIHYARGNYDDSLHFSMQALQITDLPEDDFAASLWFNLGNLLWHLEKGSEEAECSLARSLQIFTSIRKRDATPCRLDRDIVTTQTLLLLVQDRNGAQISKKPEAVSLLRLLTAQRSNMGFENETVAKTLCALGTIFLRYREPEIASRYLMESRRVQECIPKEICDADKLMTLTQLGQSLQGIGRDVDAMACFREALKMKGKNILEETSQIQAIFATVLYNIGMIQSNHADRPDPQRRVRALHSFKLCLDLRKRALGREHPAVASALHNIGILLLEDGQVTKSLECFRESLDIRRKSYGERHHEVASSLRHIGRIHQDRGEYQEALRLHHHALSILRDQPALTNSIADQMVEVLMGLGHAQHATGNLPRALKFYEDATRLLRERELKGQVKATQHIVRVLHIMGNISLDMADIPAAERFFTEAAKLSGQPVSSLADRFPSHAAAA